MPLTGAGRSLAIPPTAAKNSKDGGTTPVATVLPLRLGSTSVAGRLSREAVDGESEGCRTPVGGNMRRGSGKILSPF